MGNHRLMETPSHIEKRPLVGDVCHSSRLPMRDLQHGSYSDQLAHALKDDLKQFGWSLEYKKKKKNAGNQAPLPSDFLLKDINYEKFSKHCSFED